MHGHRHGNVWSEHSALCVCVFQFQFHNSKIIAQTRKTGGGKSKAEIARKLDGFARRVLGRPTERPSSGGYRLLFLLRVSTPLYWWLVGATRMATRH